MRNISTILSVLALVLIGVLFYLHFSGNKAPKKVAEGTDANTSNGVRIGYFDIDSLQTGYEYFKDVLEQMKKKEAAMNSELAEMDGRSRRRLQQLQAELQSRGQALTQADEVKAQNEVATMQKNFNDRKIALEQDMQRAQLETITEVRNTVADFLKEYNKTKGYTYILSYDPGMSLMYYKDTTYDVTGDLIKGLNEQYAAKKKKP